MTARLLILDDDKSGRESYAEYFRLRGSEVVEAATVADARRAYDPGLFDVLLCDYDLPDGTGLDFLSAADTDEARVVLWSGLDRSSEVAASGIRVDLVATKDATLEAFDVIDAWLSKASR